MGERPMPERRAAGLGLEVGLGVSLNIAALI
jgi:hypothetical protein